MTVEYRHRPNGGERVVMTTCPLCGYDFGPNDKRAWHFLNEHTPADCGL